VKLCEFPSQHLFLKNPTFVSAFDTVHHPVRFQVIGLNVLDKEKGPFANAFVKLTNPDGTVLKGTAFCATYFDFQDGEHVLECFKPPKNSVDGVFYLKGKYFYKLLTVQKLLKEQKVFVRQNL
jgi:hypothetical protein